MGSIINEVGDCQRCAGDPDATTTHARLLVRRNQRDYMYPVIRARAVRNIHETRMRVNSIFVTAFPLTELGSSLTHSLTLTHKSSQV